ncbi:SF1B family DNA helicase RecD2 [Eupransor demetentiae]|uniref:ATP-dependent RecD2 DNA helicase n=1 Tax=Eupransor demetentiae TaxID=3109584 RepID=A0ABM9N4J6_9LACO|nr:ATPase/5<92>-3<92> helicase helicase subunit RecD of the DNA repair enzyme RecBCD (exonuclease V) (RecD) [Lactobacillaceae bacterium LMG 33000]
MSGQDQELEQVTGTLQNIIFKASDSYFKILSIAVDDTSLADWSEPEMIVTGTFADVQEGSGYTFYGSLVTHPRYGKQFKAESYEIDLPPDENGLINYFASGQFKGIGRKTASKIVDALGVDAVHLILDDPTLLAGIVKSDLARSLVETLKRNLGLERLFQIGSQYGIGADLAGRLYDQYGQEAEEILTKEPYRLVFEFDGFAFRKVDQLALKAGFKRDDPRRIEAALYATLMNLTFRSGNTYLTEEQLYPAVARSLTDYQFSPEHFNEALSNLIGQGAVVLEDSHYYPRNLYRAEELAASKLREIIRSQAAFTLSHNRIEANYLSGQKIKLDEHQESAVKAGLASKVFVLTGGPGTGKTTIIKSIVASWERIIDEIAQQDGFGGDWLKEQRVRLASPTGRAAKRMTEITGYEATTIHRLLGITDTGEAEFNAENPIGGGLLIIDEASMLDIELAAKLLDALPPYIHLILVGDQDQLPSVGPGNVLADLIHSDVIDHVALSTIYRQGRGSSINRLAAEIKAGHLPGDFQENQNDRSTFLVEPSQTANAVRQVVAAAVKKGFNQNQVQVLTPMYKSSAGVNALNLELQELFNPLKDGKRALEYGSITFRVGDKVLQLENDSEREIYNGDMGEVIAIHSKNDRGIAEDGLVVDFDGKELDYPKKTLKQLTLAYATTIHKAQGNEFPLVIVVLTDQFAPMLNRNLLYTAITRAKEALVLVGQYSAFQRAAEQAIPVRQTSLVERLEGDLGPAKKTAKKAAVKQEIKAEKPVPTADSQVLSKTAESLPRPALSHELTLNNLDEAMANPMIGMDGISPEDFMA